MRKPAFYICENKDADQLRGNCEADQRLCFRFIESTIPLLPKSEFHVSNHFLLQTLKKRHTYIYTLFIFSSGLKRNVLTNLRRRDKRLTVMNTHR